MKVLLNNLINKVNMSECVKNSYIYVNDYIEKGYIYVREHESYNIYDSIKLGITLSIPERENTYKTSELKKGKFILVFEIEKAKLRIIDNLLKFKFQKLNIKFNGGTEFYKKEIKNEIENYFNELKIKYKKLSEDKINELNKKYRIKKLYEKINKLKLIKYLKNNKKINQFLTVIKKMLLIKQFYFLRIMVLVKYYGVVV